jgi:hypothetical protein
MSESHTMTDPRRSKWGDVQNGRPATVAATEQDGHAGILRIDFGTKEDALEEIEWSEIFSKFDEAITGVSLPRSDERRKSQPLP